MQFPNSVFQIIPTKKSITAKLPNVSSFITINKIPLSISSVAAVYKVQGNTLNVIFIPLPRKRGEKSISYNLLLIRYYKLVSFETTDGKNLKFVRPQRSLIDKISEQESIFEQTINDYRSGLKK